MNKQELNNLKEEFNKLTAMITNTKSVTEDLEKKADKIKKQLEDAEKKATDGKLREWWTPKDRESYFTICSNGEVVDLIWTGAYECPKRFNYGNCFKTKEEAEFEVERRKVYFELKKYVYEHDPRPITKEDWEDPSIKKYFIEYWFDKGTLEFDFYYECKFTTVIYASNEQTLKDAIKAIGEDRIKKYLFEVE